MNKSCKYVHNYEKKKCTHMCIIFPSQKGTYQQHLASKELKKKSWKYHKKYTTWFFPYGNNIRISNDKSEKGTYFSFDYETSNNYKQLYSQKCSCENSL